ncbi:response regulator [Paenibacillus sp. J5C_2022]|uniref:response regulator n=1 Tax=Paenibacillus sp. J5C2022 TaxID=2977129 RepID=UPI0021D1750F|nr:response regulator [Paenibacillus sp. J5C2022]MCU6711966.1 response regulator [Paenibacillus sp. J5C2022]
MYKAIVVEDEIPNLELMKVMLTKFSNIDIIGSFDSPLEAFASMKESTDMPHVAFIDIEMPEMNGIAFARKLLEHCPRTAIVFATAYREYALEAFDVQALDYILKPVTPPAIERVLSRLEQHTGGMEDTNPSLAGSAEIRCFGGFEVRSSAGGLIRFPSRKAEELCAYLLCHPGRDISKWQLIDLLWPNMEIERATHNLHNAVYLLKKLIKDNRLHMELKKTNDGYVLESNGPQYDYLLFQSQARLAGLDPSGRSHAEQLCLQYRGALLEGKPYLWKLALEEESSKQYEALIGSIVRSHMSLGNWSLAEEWLLRLLAIYPLHDEMNGLLLELYGRSGKREKAMAHYNRLREAYIREMGMEPPWELKEKATAE